MQTAQKFIMPADTSLQQRTRTLLYKHSRSENPPTNAALFIYVGDGSPVKEIDGFKLGTILMSAERFFPIHGRKRRKDENMGLGRWFKNRANEIALISDYRFRNDLLWKFNLKYMDAPRANYSCKLRQHHQRSNRQ